MSVTLTNLVVDWFGWIAVAFEPALVNVQQGSVVDAQTFDFNLNVGFAVDFSISRNPLTVKLYDVLI
jgi:hypothetical protein